MSIGPSTVPLAEKMRPKSLDEVAGQHRLLGERGVLRKLLAVGRLPSIVFWGPPGTGKTTLARLLAQLTKRPFLEFSGVTGSAAELKKFLQECHDRPLFRATPPVIFLDEIHRYNRAQQDILLPYLERGEAILIGATTENPAFYLNPALRSRCQLLAVEPIAPEDVLVVLCRAWERERPGASEPAEVFDWLSRWAGGDLRSALTGLETWLGLAETEQSLEVLQEALGGRIMFDRADGHYDLASAFQKSLRGSDADAALYYLSRMIRGGEDPRFIARRLMVCAAEDVGNADPQAFILAETVSRAVERIGWPEARIPLAQAVIYVANAPKSNATVAAIDAAMAAPDHPVPESLRDAHTAVSRAAGRGKGYFYSHDDYTRRQELLPEALRGTRFHQPIRPQERSWLDRAEPDLPALTDLLQRWAAEHPAGGEIPLDDWCREAGCSREALARALPKIASGSFVIERRLVAKPLAGEPS